MSVINFHPIGTFHSEQQEPYQAARQPDELSAEGYIQLEPQQQFEQALQDLEGCSHIWILFTFHKNQNWKPLVQTPRSDRKIGVFATRAPYRPNNIGMSVVELKKIEGLKIYVGPNDLLNESPILDIKPYHPESDRIEHAQIAWLAETAQPFDVHFSPLAVSQIDYLEDLGLKELRPFIHRQLEYDPTNKKKKRVEEKTGYWQLSYRTWRIDFVVSDLTISILSIYSGYTDQELNSGEDTYGDFDIHKKFIKEFT